MKTFLDKGKYAAPRWLVYPQLSFGSIGWRMGYGEEYALNEPWQSEEFSKLFCEPQNWQTDFDKITVRPVPLMGFMWRNDCMPKYSRIGEVKITANEIIEMSDEREFQFDHFKFRSIEHAILFSKYATFGKIDGDETTEELRQKFTLKAEEEDVWNHYKYTVCLNALYYLFMQDEELKEKLLQTGDAAIVYESDDEWGGHDNLFGFALMELRDEIRRLYRNEDLIDWEYTEYLKVKNPYEDYHGRNPEDKQSPEYRIVESTLNSSSAYVRDANLSDEIAGKYECGQIITERAFVDASAKIGGMATSHRYLILSAYMIDLSEFDDGRGWAMHVAKNGSKFKVLDVYEARGKTQIILLQLPEGFEEVFETHRNIEDDFILHYRGEFRKALKEDVVESLSSKEWLERCSFPLGMSDDGEFF